jgi:hypothetical protein
MRLVVSCRLFALLAILAMTLGMVAHGVQAASMGASMVAAASMDMSAPENCGGCPGGDEQGGMVMETCFALCGATTALPPVVAAVHSSPAEQPVPLVASFSLGRTGPPDPYPPRPDLS